MTATATGTTATRTYRDYDKPLWQRVLLTVIGSSLAVLDINQFWQQAIVGSLILLAIGADRLVALRVARSLKKRDSHVR